MSSFKFKYQQLNRRGTINDATLIQLPISSIASLQSLFTTQVGIYLREVSQLQVEYGQSSTNRVKPRKTALPSLAICEKSCSTCQEAFCQTFFR